MQEELHDPGLGSSEVALPCGDVLKPLLPELRVVRSIGLDRLGGEQLRMHPYYEHLLVVRPVEHADVTASRQRKLCPPEKGVRLLYPIWLLARRHRDALGIHPPHHVLDRSVLA